MELIKIILDFFVNLILPRLKEFIKAIIDYPDVFWTVLPLLIAAIGMQIYFGRNKEEDMGWNSAFGNSVSFTWVSANLLRYLFNTYSLIDFRSGIALEKLLITLAFLIWGLYLMFGNLIHSIPKKIAFIISASYFINTLAIVVSIIVMSNLPFDRITTYAAAVLLILIMLFEFIVRILVNPSPEAAEYLRKKSIVAKSKRTKKIHKIERRIKDVFKKDL